jgi:hypothetical protein
MATESTGRGRRILEWARTNWIPLTHLALCAAVIAPISAQPGWPLGHDGYPLFQRVEAFRREFAAGNLLPLWTPFGNNGHGMPMPLFYHRLFSTAAGLLALALGTVSAVKVALMPTLAIGSTGMAARRGARLPALDPSLERRDPPLAHYTFVNWLIRASAAGSPRECWSLARGRVSPHDPERPSARDWGRHSSSSYHISICLYSVSPPSSTAAVCCLVDGRRAPCAR